jgi:hypothetical protein
MEMVDQVSSAKGKREEEGREEEGAVVPASVERLPPSHEDREDRSDGVATVRVGWEEEEERVELNEEEEETTMLGRKRRTRAGTEVSNDGQGLSASEVEGEAWKVAREVESEWRVGRERMCKG